MLRKCKVADGRLVEAEDGPIWVVSTPDDADRKVLVEGLGIDEHTLSSAVDPDELSRVEHEPDHAAVILKRPKSYSKDDDFLFKVVSNGLFLFRDKLLVVLPEEGPVLDATRVPYKPVSTPADVLLRILYRTVFHFLEHLRVISMLSDALERRVAESLDNRHLLNLFKLEKSLVYYLFGISSNAVAIERLKNGAAKLGLSPEQIEFLDDIAIENQQCYRQAEIASNILAGLMDARVSIVSNNLNLTMKTLTILTLTIMLPTLVVSIFSMNVPLPLQAHPWGFWAVLGLAGATSLALLGWGRYRRW